MSRPEIHVERILAEAGWPEGAELWSSDADRRYWALDHLAGTAFMRHVTDAATVRMTPVVLPLLTDPRLDGAWTRTSFAVEP
ncbi:hypothetical protein AB0J72_50225 [Dactylosporangium sp. NPDC049742]|uniref:hypothetical protein n=1 Tax=Dactylosporangium sp. NPDC049742 TaxID=3154737 RepID=UPI00343B6A7F